MLAVLASLGGYSEWPQNVRIKRALLVVLIGIVTIVEINFVGDTTIYSMEVANIREELHDSIVHNHPPAGGWVKRGANAAMNIRVVIPYLVAIVAVLIKFDAIVLPGPYFLGNATYQTWPKYLFKSSAIAIILFVIFEGLSLSG
jgi:hypothetical protein